MKSNYCILCVSKLVNDTLSHCWDKTVIKDIYIYIYIYIYRWSLISVVKQAICMISKEMYTNLYYTHLISRVDAYHVFNCTCFSFIYSLYGVDILFKFIILVLLSYKVI